MPWWNNRSKEPPASIEGMMTLPLFAGRSRYELLQAGIVDAWRISLSAGERHLAALTNMLSSHERRCSERYVRSADRRRAVVSRGLLRHLIGQYLAVAPNDVLISVGEHGKPFISHPMRFNVTHSGDVVAFAFCVGREVGIDVERIDPGIDIAMLARNVFSASELKQFEALTHREQVGAFFAGWTRKEALLKALGNGLTKPLREIEMSVGRSPQPLLRSVAWHPHGPASCCVVDLPLRGGYAAALAVHSPTEPAVCMVNTPDAA